MAELRMAGWKMQQREQAVRKMTYLEKLLQIQEAAKETGLPQAQWFSGERTPKNYWVKEIGREISGKTFYWHLLKFNQLQFTDPQWRLRELDNKVLMELATLHSNYELAKKQFAQ
jgi:hypothetical protein